MKKILVVIALVSVAYSANAQRSLQIVNTDAADSAITTILGSPTGGERALAGGGDSILTFTGANTAGHVIVANGSVRNSVALSGDASLTSAGVFSLTKINGKALDASVLAPSNASIIIYDASLNAGAGGWRAAALTTTLSVNATSGAVSITDNVIALSKLAQATAESVLIGRGQGGGVGNFQEITLGSGLSMTGQVLSATGGGLSGGTNNVVTKWTGATTVGTSSITDDATTVSTTSNLSTAGDLSLTGSNKQVSFKGNSTGVTTFKAGTQGATNINYILPTTLPTAVGASLRVTNIAGSDVTLDWVQDAGSLSLNSGDSGDTWVVPYGVTTIYVKITGAGGGGGGGGGDDGTNGDGAGGGGGGGGGATVVAHITVSPGETLTFHIGGGGTGSAGGAASGGTGNAADGETGASTDIDGTVSGNNLIVVPGATGGEGGNGERGNNSPGEGDGGNGGTGTLTSSITTTSATTIITSTAGGDGTVGDDNVDAFANTGGSVGGGSGGTAVDNNAAGGNGTDGSGATIVITW